MTPKALQHLWLAWNKTLFKGRLKLPSIRKARGENKKTVTWGHYRFFDNQVWEYRPGKRPRRKNDEIMVRSVLKDHEQLWVLLHEMVHQWERRVIGKRGQPPHTPRFIRKIKALHKKLGWKPPPKWSYRND
jgi:hypothetical protein